MGEGVRWRQVGGAGALVRTGGFRLTTEAESVHDSAREVLAPTLRFSPPPPSPPTGGEAATSAKSSNSPLHCNTAALADARGRVEDREYTEVLAAVVVLTGSGWSHLNFAKSCKIKKITTSKT